VRVIGDSSEYLPVAVIVDVAQSFGLDFDAAEKAATSIAVRSGATLVEVRAHEYAGRRAPVAVFVAS
jgi:hypothetical protein